MAIDYLYVVDKANPTIAPGGVTTDLALWLKGNSGLSYSDGQSVSLWQDQGRGSDARPYKAGQEPTYRDNANRNVNFNPVVEFDNTYSSFTIDSDYSHDNLAEEFLTGDFGYYTQVIPGCFFRLGVRNESAGIVHNVHTPHFNIDEAAIEHGVGMMAWLAVQL